MNSELLIKELPKDVSKHIYETYFWFDNKNNPLPLQDLKEANYLLDWFLYSDDAQRLKMDSKIFHLLLKLTKKKTCVQYLCSKDVEFALSYKEHFEKKKKMFKLMSREESFFLSILMYKYH